MIVEPSMRRRQIAYYALLVLLLFLIIFIRAPEVLMLPTLRVEDGAKVFAHFYQNRGWDQLLRFKQGYIPLVANLIGFISVRFPTRMTPYVLAWIPLFIALVTYSVFFHRRYAAFVPSGRLRFFICVLFTFAPINKRHFIVLTDYSIWNTFLLLLFFSMVRFPSKYRVPFLLACCILTWSHPLAIVALPASIYFLFKDGQNRIYYVVIIFNHLLHQIFGVEMPQGLSGRGLADFVQVAVTSLGSLVDLSFLTFFGGETLEAVSQNARFLPYAWSIGFLAVIVILCRADKGLRRLCLILGYYIVSITALTALTRGVDVLEHIGGSRRYVYVQSLFLLLIMAVALVHILTWAINKVKDRFGTNRMTLVSAQSIAIGLLVGYYLVQSSLNPGAYHHKYPENGYIVRDFFQRLAEEEKKLGSYQGIYLRADKIDDWSIIIDTRENKPPDVTDVQVIYHDGYYDDGAGRYEEGVFPWMDLLAKLGDSWYGPERAPSDDMDAQPLLDGLHWECEGGFGCHPNGEAWWTESSNQGIARLIGPSDEVLIEVPLNVAFQGPDDG
jgi:hypothetical protein